MYIPVLLVLSQNADSFSLYDGRTLLKVTDKINVSPNLWNSTTCKTQEEVLKFLQNLKEDENFRPFHINTTTHAYHIENHLKTDEGIAHHCPIYKMKQFVVWNMEQNKSAKL
jgi:hypothetical protein